MKTLLKFIFYLFGLFVVSSLLGVLVYRYVPVRVTPLMIIRAVEGKDSYGWDWKHEWVDLEDMSIYMPLAVVASEDQNFLEHSGFDWKAIEDAYQEAQKGKRIRGGSTISQQTAKNVFLWPKSSWIRKGFEAYFTVLIEFFWSKERIMEVYLNSIEMGPGIYGVEAVAKENFNVSANKLKFGDCALIAATLPNPRKFSSKHPSFYMLKRKRNIQRSMVYNGFEPLFSEKRQRKMQK